MKIKTKKIIAKEFIVSLIVTIGILLFYIPSEYYKVKSVIPISKDTSLIRVSYDLFVMNGYTKSIDEFKTLVIKNDNAFEDSYTLFTENFNNMDKNVYKIIMGVSPKGEKIIESRWISYSEFQEIVLIFLIIGFPLRWIYYGFKWSVSTLKTKEAN